MNKQGKKIETKTYQKTEGNNDKDDSKGLQEWQIEKMALMKRIAELEKEMKVLRKHNLELQNQLIQQQQQQQLQLDDRKSINIKSSRNENSKYTLALNPNSLEKFSINNNRKSHKRVTSELLATNFKRKIKQNSDDITRSEVIKRIIKQKPNSFGGPGKILENKVLNSIIKEFRRDMIKSQEQLMQNYNTIGKTTTLPNSATNNNNNNNNPLLANGNFTIVSNSKAKVPFINQIDYSAYYTENNTNKTKQSLHSLYSIFQPKSLNENKVVLTQVSTQSNNQHTNDQLSERENENESSSATQETIIQKPLNFSQTNSFSNRNESSFNNSTSNNNININNNQAENGLNINITTSSQINDSINLHDSSSMIRYKQSNNTSQSKENSSSQSSIIFQPQAQKDFKSSYSNSNNNSIYSYNPIAVLKYHLDSVRGVYINPSQKVLVSISEDSLICFWDLDKAIKHYKENQEPYMSIRSHTTPVFTITGPKAQSHPFESVYTSGADGVIRATKIPSIQSKKDESTMTECALLPWRGHQDMIWQLDYHTKASIMSSVSSDGTVKIFKCYEEDNTDKRYYSYDSGSNKNVLRNLIFRNHYYNLVEIPTSSTWSFQNDNHLYVSHIASYIRKYDIETGQSIADISYTVEKNIPFESQQANRIIYHNMGLVCTGHEDHQIRFFDVNSNCQVKAFVAHADSISCLSNGLNEYEMLSGSHDGTVRCWDLRINKLIFDIPAHRKKYDEGCLSLSVIPLSNLMITSGADGIIKIFQL